MIVRCPAARLSRIVVTMLTNEIPMDALMALAAQRRARFTAEAERFRLARTFARALRPRRARTRGDEVAGTRVTAAPARPCA